MPRSAFFLFLIASLLLSGCIAFKPPAYSVSGHVMTEEGAGIPGVALSFTGDAGTATTDAGGRWQKGGLTGEVTVSAAKDGYIFSPSDRSVSSAGDAVNFTGYPTSSGDQPLPAGRIAFVSKRSGSAGYDIYTMDADGTHVSRVTAGGTWDVAPRWSPDHTSIVYHAIDVWSRKVDLYTIDANGSHQRRLTTSGTDYRPDWSPDGTQIAFTRYVGETNTTQPDESLTEIYVMNTDGSHPVRLTQNDVLDEAPIWSPDGTKIAFSSKRDGTYEIYTMETLDAKYPWKHVTRLTYDPVAQDLYPAWSPDGTKIAFATSRDGNYEIYVMDADGGNPTNLTHDPGHDVEPAWSPNGTHIAFTSYRDDPNNPEIYVMRADGTHQVRVTHNAGPDYSPAW